METQNDSDYLLLALNPLDIKNHYISGILDFNTSKKMARFLPNSCVLKFAISTKNKN